MRQEDDVRATRAGATETTQRLTASKELQTSDILEKDNNFQAVEALGDSNAVNNTDYRSIVDWEGPQDPENPLNWSVTRKVIIIGNISFITFLSYDVALFH